MVLKCKKLAQKQYWCCREDKMVQMIHWNLFCLWNAGLWQGWQIHVLHELQPVYMYESSNWATMIHNQCMNPLTTAMIHNQCMNPLTRCCGTSKYKLTTRLNTTSCIEWNRTEVPDYWCCLSIWHLNERESWELTKTWSGSWKVSGNYVEWLCGSSHNWCNEEMLW